MRNGDRRKVSFPHASANRDGRAELAKKEIRNEATRNFERVPASGDWWIRYADTMSRIHREKAGTKGTAVKLYRKRKTEVLQGKKLPESLRSPMVSFAELSRDALAYSKRKEFVRQVEQAKTQETRDRRIAGIVAKLGDS